MRKKVVITLYTLSFAVLIAVIWFVFSIGKELGQAANTIQSSNKANGIQIPIIQSVTGSLQHPLAIFILQLILIITLSQLCAWLFRKIGQPSVMGEIIAGILLGPSFMGYVLPQLSAFIFPVGSMGNLQILSQVGLILFMFVIGMELDLYLLKRKAGIAVFISYFSIIVPFGLGITLSLILYRQYASDHIPFYTFSLFIGIAMSITAFPVLARIIKERNLSNTRLGVIAITAAAIGDVAAWCMLAFIIAIVNAGSIGSSVGTLVEAIAFLILTLTVVRPLLKKVANMHTIIKRSSVAIVFVTLLLSSYCCEIIGIHALFGAFLAGIIMPVEWNFRKLLINKIEDVALVLLLPLFFVFTGLRTQIGLLHNASQWLMCLLIIVIAIVGKMGGSLLAARAGGESMKDSLSIGALMNTRGLVELVVLNIGYDLHILSAEIFTMMVIMALITTFMTNPMINIVNKLYKDG